MRPVVSAGKARRSESSPLKDSVAKSAPWPFKVRNQPLSLTTTVTGSRSMKLWVDTVASK